MVDDATPNLCMGALGCEGIKPGIGKAWEGWPSQGTARHGLKTAGRPFAEWFSWCLHTDYSARHGEDRYGMARYGRVRHGLSTAGCISARECILMRSASTARRSELWQGRPRRGRAWHGSKTTENPRSERTGGIFWRPFAFHPLNAMGADSVLKRGDDRCSAEFRPLLPFGHYDETNGRKKPSDKPF